MRKCCWLENLEGALAVWVLRVLIRIRQLGLGCCSFMARVRKNDKVHVAWCVGGVIGCLVLYGVLQVRSEAACARQTWALSLAAVFGRQVC